MIETRLATHLRRRTPETPTAMNTKTDSRLPGAAARCASRLTRTLLACTLAAAPLFAPAASASPSGAKQDMPGLADTPGSPNAAVSKPLANVKFQTENGLAVLDSAILLKAYYYAYAGVQVDYSAILTANTENIVKPVLVQPTASDKAAIDGLIKDAKAHPDILIKVSDIALDPYDRKTGSFEVVNRLFVDGGRFYFDNSPFHYIYSNPASYRTLPCRDAKAIASINSAVANYGHFSMEIEAHFLRPDMKNKSLTFELRKVVLQDEIGNTLIALSKP
jgi:hypothetical protein